jgi:hypothetical protein
MQTMITTETMKPEGFGESGVGHGLAEEGGHRGLHCDDRDPGGDAAHVVVLLYRRRSEFLRRDGPCVLVRARLLDLQSARRRPRRCLSKPDVLRVAWQVCCSSRWPRCWPAGGDSVSALIRSHAGEILLEKGV